MIAAALSFLPRSGFTAKAAGTEAGVGQPEPTFSPCFTSTSLVWHPVSPAGMACGWHFNVLHRAPHAPLMHAVVLQFTHCNGRLSSAFR